jgi:sugar phosphate isomerase/epimerase
VDQSRSENLTLRDRIGIDFGRRMSAEDAMRFAARHEVRFADIQTDVAPNALESFDDKHCAAVRQAAAEGGVTFGLHSLSAVNVAEISPFLRDAADAYLRAYIDLAARLGAQWVDVHAGYHFTADVALRRKASVERLKRAVACAEERGVLLLLENLNREPEHAEVHYMCSDLQDARTYFEEIDSPHLAWTFTANHAHLEPEGIEGFLREMPFERCREVRLADNTGEYEIHLRPGEGTIDFSKLFASIEGKGFDGHYMSAYGSAEDMVAGREYLVAQAR